MGRRDKALLYINGKVYAGIKPYYELKDILLKAGAVEKK